MQTEYIYPNEIWKLILSYNTEYLILKKKQLN